jgi:hippurate hydrolase
MRKITLISFILFGLAVSLAPSVLAMSLQESVQKDEQRLINIFERLHQNPELAYMEFETSALVANEFKAHGYTVHTKIAKTGVVGVMKNGPGPVVLFRSDMDALPLKEETTLSYKSTAIKKDVNGNEYPTMHACGHDAHTTWLIGMAKQLAERRNEWSGTLILVAQPAEEDMTGALAMVDDGLYKIIPKPDIIISAHTMGVVPAGSIAIKEGQRMAGSDQIDVVIRGVGGHGSAPQAAKDPVVMGAMAVMAYQAVVARGVDQYQPAVLTVGAFQAGIANNIIPDSATLKLNLRWYRETERQQMIQGIKSVTDNIANMYNIPKDRMPTYDMKNYATPVINADPEDVKRARTAMVEVLGNDRVMVGMPPVMGSEDFQMLGTPYPDTRILYIEVGSGAPDVYTNYFEKGILPTLNHNPRYVVEKKAIATATIGLTATVMAFLPK